jgi:putative sterol carrier protein
LGQGRNTVVIFFRIQAFMSGKLKTGGDMMFTQKYQSLFSF